MLTLVDAHDRLDEIREGALPVCSLRAQEMAHGKPAEIANGALAVHLIAVMWHSQCLK